MLSLSQWWSEFQHEVAHPLDTLSALLSSTQPVSGAPTELPNGMLDFGGSAPVDSVASAQVRAYGVDPVTGGLVAPQYLASAKSAGYDPLNPFDFINKTEADAVSFYNQQLAKNQQQENSDGSNVDSSGLTLVLVVVAILLVIKAVA